MRKPCCLQEIKCVEYERLNNAKYLKMAGNEIGKSDECPRDASEAHKINQQSKEISGPFAKSNSYTDYCIIRHI